MQQATSVTSPQPPVPCCAAPDTSHAATTLPPALPLLRRRQPVPYRPRSRQHRTSPMLSSAAAGKVGAATGDITIVPPADRAATDARHAVVGATSVASAAAGIAAAAAHSAQTFLWAVDHAVDATADMAGAATADISAAPSAHRATPGTPHAAARAAASVAPVIAPRAPTSALPRGVGAITTTDATADITASALMEGDVAAAIPVSVGTADSPRRPRHRLRCRAHHQPAKCLAWTHFWGIWTRHVARVVWTAP